MVSLCSVLMRQICSDVHVVAGQQLLFSVVPYSTGALTTQCNPVTSVHLGYWPVAATLSHGHQVSVNLNDAVAAPGPAMLVAVCHRTRTSATASVCGCVCVPGVVPGRGAAPSPGGRRITLMMAFWRDLQCR
jgi:hypothetical protein